MRHHRPRVLAALAAALLLATGCAGGATATPVDQSKKKPKASVKALTNVAVHDPALVAGGEGEDWYVFGTGDPNVADGNITIHTSPNGQQWTAAGHVWQQKPAWLVEEVPGVTNLWAPEVYEHDGTYYLYYSASTFGSNHSVIGLATNTTLNPDDPDYAWVDQGKVYESTEGDDFNAIDPGIVEGADGTPHMAFGSFWSGIRMIELEWPSGKVAPGQGEPLHLAHRRTGDNAIEAPYITRHDGYYYLFVSFDTCCSGTDSTYKIAVGRSESVTGPYVDANGVPMLEGGGTVLLADRGDAVAHGGQSLSGGFMAYHAYGPYDTPGQFLLGVEEVQWTADGWPQLSG